MALRVSVLVAVTATILAQGISNLAAQTPSSAALAFEAASVKPNTSGSMSISGGWEPGGLFTGVNITAEGLIAGAYPSKVHELLGAPDWLSRDRFNVTARAAFQPTPKEREGMLRVFLADRFRLVAHYQSDERSVYKLERARPDGALGPRLHALNIQCDMFKPVGQAPQLLTYQEQPCGFRMNAGGDELTVVSGGRTMDNLGDVLGGLVGRPVIDNTGLPGYYEFSLDFPDDHAGGALFTALREQLGLKLESARAPVDVLVIDHVEHPTEN